MHRSHTQQLAPFLAAQLGAHNTIDTRPDGLAALVDEHAGVVVEAHAAAVAALQLVLGAHDDGVADVAALDLGGVGGRRAAQAALARGGALLLHDAHDAVADGGVALLPEDHGAFDDGGAAVVDAVEHCLVWGIGG